MPIEFEIHRPVIRFRTQGDVDFHSGLDVLTAALEGAALRQEEAPDGWHLLFDISGSSENRGSEEMRGIAALIGSYEKMLSGRCAVVANDPLRYGMARMFGTFMENLGLAASVFRSVEEAEGWLGASTRRP